MARSEYHSKLNEWHLELAIAVSALERLLVLQDDDDTGSLGHVLKTRFHQLVESCPFPEADEVPHRSEARSATAPH
jgi:hypothetical protein